MQRPIYSNPKVRVGMRGLVLAVATGLAVHFPVSPLSAQAQWEVPRSEPGQYQRPEAAQEAMDQLKSPYCPGLMLEVCPSPGGAALRDSLNMLAEDGWSSDQLVDWVLANHGNEWLALPRAEGRSWPPSMKAGLCRWACCWVCFWSSSPSGGCVRAGRRWSRSKRTSPRRWKRASGRRCGSWTRRKRRPSSRSSTP